MFRLLRRQKQTKMRKNLRRTDPQELKQTLEALDATQAIIKPVLEHFQYLSSMPSDTLTKQQKLWLLAYAAVDQKFAPGTEAAMKEAALLIPILYDNIS
jgi:hypothetical protein